MSIWCLSSHPTNTTFVLPNLRGVRIELTVEQASVAIQAADAGKHVFIEKPMTLTVEDAERVISAQKRNNVRSLFPGWSLAWLH